MWRGAVLFAQNTEDVTLLRLGIGDGSMGAAADEYRFFKWRVTIYFYQYRTTNGENV